MKQPKLSPSQLATVLGDTVSGDAVKTDPALPNGPAPDGSAGEVGKTPWRAVERHNFPNCVFIMDFNGNVMGLTDPKVASRVIFSVNAWTKLFGDNCNHRDLLRALQVQLMPLRAMPAIRRALELIETTLLPKDDLQS